MRLSLATNVDDATAMSSTQTANNIVSVSLVLVKRHVSIMDRLKPIDSRNSTKSMLNSRPACFSP